MITAKPEDFCHLHAHSHMSLKDGSIPIRKLVDIQIDHGSKAVAITDHGNMIGAWDLYDYIHNIAKYDAHSIIGCEFYLSETRNELMEWLPIAKEDCPNKNDRKDKRSRCAIDHGHTKQ